jgi:phage baseplate assembly protein W
MASKYIDIPLELGKVGLVKDSDQVTQQVRVLLNTEPGEFIDIPNYGTPIKRYLYEGITENTANLLRMAISHSLSTWMEGQVRVDGIEVKEDRDNNTMVVELNLFLVEFNKSVGVVESFKA